jgi:hypothetical protein
MKSQPATNMGNSKNRITPCEQPAVHTVRCTLMNHGSHGDGRRRAPKSYDQHIDAQAYNFRPSPDSSESSQHFYRDKSICQFPHLCDRWGGSFFLTRAASGEKSHNPPWSWLTGACCTAQSRPHLGNKKNSQYVFH